MALFYIVQDIIHYTASTISLATTVVLLYLIVQKSPREMNVYRWLIFYISATDALTTITLLLGNFRPIANVWLSISALVEGPLIFHDCGYHYFSAFITSLTLNWISLPLCFTYRYLSLFNRQKILKKLFSAKSTIVIGAFFLICGAVMYSLVFISGKFENYVEVLRTAEHTWADYAKYLGTRNFTYDEDDVFVYSFYNPNIVITFVVIVTFLTGVYIYNACISWLIIRNLHKRRRSMSAKTYEAHKQLLIVLAVQTAMPLLCVLIPTFIFFASVIYWFVSFELIEIVRSIFAVGVALNPTLTIVLIKPYRRALLDSFRSTVRRQSMSTTAVVAII